MKESKTQAQEGSDKNLIEDIHQINNISLGEGAAVCEVCGEKLREGAPIVVFAFRPAEQPAFKIGHVKCIDCRHEPSEFFTLGVRELVLDGRIGTCSDPVTQSSWPVLLAPQPRAVSPPDATTVHPLPGSTWFRKPIARSDTYVAADCESARKPWQRPVVRADNANLDSTSKPEPDSKDNETAETTTPHALDGGRRGEVQ
ncbi:hypothetical protein [Natronorubrum tibetense]|uniref:hypothetical protein n=1 Tax=Natronorubrum tibetense TaxID=63128 RepID=UPI000362C431|nr:hypothetical protein [Natronorubrum tibetense]